MIDVTCTRCGQALVFPDELSGCSARCSECRAAVKIPAIESFMPSNSPNPGKSVPMGQAVDIVILVILSILVTVMVIIGLVLMFYGRSIMDNMLGTLLFVGGMLIGIAGQGTRYLLRILRLIEQNQKEK